MAYKDEMISQLSVQKRLAPIGCIQTSYLITYEAFFSCFIETLEHLANSGMRVESVFAWDLSNSPNKYVKQIAQRFAVIDPKEDVDSMEKAANGEIAKLLSRVNFDYRIRNEFTDRYVQNLRITEQV